MPPDSKSADLADRCREEVERFLLGSKIESTHCYELFRMACVRSDQRAWDAVYSSFSFLVCRWVVKDARYRSCGEPVDALVNRAFFSFYRYVTPERFDEFPTLGSLLAYLKRCTFTAVSDAWRRNKRRSAGEIATDPSEMARSAAEERDPTDAVALWQWVESHLRGDRERRLADLAFRRGMPPREIVREDPEMFPDVVEVRRMLANILRRLRRDEKRHEFL